MNAGYIITLDDVGATHVCTATYTLQYDEDCTVFAVAEPSEGDLIRQEMLYLEGGLALCLGLIVLLAALIWRKV